MELVFIGPVLLPITPEKIEISKPGANNTTRLINDGEINILHDVGLKTFTFDVILPSGSSYPFQNYSLGGMEAVAFTSYFDELQKRKMPFPFIQVTSGGGSNGSGSLNMGYSNTLCTIEEQSVTRDSANGLDYVVSLSLKEYKEYGTKYVSTAAEDSSGKVSYKSESQTTNKSQASELTKLSSEITAKIGAAGATAASSFMLSAENSSGKQQNAQKSNDFMGW